MNVVTLRKLDLDNTMAISFVSQQSTTRLRCLQNGSSETIKKYSLLPYIFLNINNAFQTILTVLLIFALLIVIDVISQCFSYKFDFRNSI